MTDGEGVSVCCVGGERVADAAATLEAGVDRVTTTVVESVDEAVAAPDCVLVDEAALDDVAGAVGRLRDARACGPVVVYGDGGGFEAALEAGAAAVVRRDAAAAVLCHRVESAVEETGSTPVATGRDRALQSLMAYSTDRLSVLDEDGRYVFASPAVERTMGYAPSELVGTASFEYIHPEDRAAVRETFEAILSDPEATYETEYRFRSADGEWRWVEARGQNCLDDPAIEGVVVNSWDVTERKEREEALAAERALTESVFAALPDVFYAFDRNGNFLRWNDRLLEVTGYGDDEITDMHPADFVAPEDREAVFEAITTVVEEGTAVTVEADFVTKDGERVPYEFTGAEMTDSDGETLGLVGIGRDVSERKERQRRFEAVFDNTYQFTGLMEPDGTLVEANESAIEFAGVDREDVLGQKLWETFWFRVDEESRETAREAVSVAREGELYREETTVRGNEDTEIIDFSVRPVVDEQGDVTLLIPEGRLISELKQRERHLKVLHRFLRHNLRNKLTVIDGNADYVRSQLADEALASQLDEILGASRSLIELSETAHELSKVVIEAEGDRRPVALDSALSSAAADVREEYPSASIRLPEDASYAVRADWRLTVVFRHLLENAVAHADCEEPTVAVFAAETDDGVAVRVADEGPGVPKSELAGITTGEERTQLTHGTGFGLWLVRSVVDDYGGDLDHESPEEWGSVFVVRLHAADGETNESDE
ncbi:PAS domain-containing protein [Halobacterium litoreum]|uniref:histidine kinase n=1 Tax=Halobacterium litoreum TaxID=2039234 RepID=A0ABD5NDR0_9EURY|nr:PAS domain S-box protein [Halobacterium litoreum]UHH13956.1 PAS domain S-box protein [Halobacterium litoreum]